MFRRFEFRGLLNRVDELDAALPAQERPKLEGQDVAWSEGTLAPTGGRVGLAIADGRIAVASEEGVVVAEWDPRRRRCSATPRSSRTTRRRCTSRSRRSTTR